MSYILDALKRADSERERGLIPGLHAQPTPVNTPAHGTYRAFKPLMLLPVGAGLVLLCVMLWRWLGPDTASAPVQISTAPVVPAMSATAPVTPSPAASALADKPAAPIAAKPDTPAYAEAARPPVSKPAQPPRMVMAPAQITPAPSAAPNSAPERGPDRGEPETRSAPPRTLALPTQPANPIPMATTPGTTPAPAALVQRVAPLAELPAEIRLTMPKLVISGATYADNPAYRMLIINGQVFHEGEKIAADLLLEQIRPKSAVLNFKGQRYSLGY
ncbi:MAG: general secretion pathway protein GspB [Polaromonas sp.]|nr:general secretion pathway protein GspB [Polaromonas sp.]